ncbi:MAG: hypothetical protein H6818_19330 [Phycisphaerales bacterium]|nr:hypothetical protein [Phycisphaerales bacterium]MCB9863620.1 hypothetical protein [Phycisphaerales bacterium]
MIRRITIAFGFLATLWVVDYAVRRGDGQLCAYTMDRIARKHAVLESHATPPGIVIFGSSRTAYGMVPDEFESVTGLKAFNFGIPASKVFEWRLIMKRALSRVRPKVVVLGVNASAIRADELPTYAAWSLFDTSDFIEYTLGNGWSNEVAASFFDGRLRRGCATVGRRDEVRFWIQEQLASVFPKHAQLARERREMVAEPCSEDGYNHPWLYHKRLRNLQEQIDERGEAFVQKGSIPRFEPSSPALAEFDRLLGDMNALRIPLVVCYLPNSPRTEARWRDVEPSMKDALARACVRRGVEFVDGTPADVVRVNSDYVDESHAGLGLARAISHRAAAYVVAMGLLDPEGPVYAAGRDEGTLGP